MEGKSGTKEYYASYYQRKKEEHNARMKEYKKQHPEKEKKYVDKWHKNNSDKVKNSWRSSKNNQNILKRNFIQEYKQNCSCSKCNDTRSYVLDFHHTDPTKKDFNIGDATKHGLEKIKQELEKCVPLCRNCHSEFHYFEKENNLTIKDYLNIY